jgi:periplasmic protein CpxP/Spy
MKKLLANRRNRIALIIPAVVAAGLFTMGAANADAGWFGKNHHERGGDHYERMEHIADKLDMTDEQEQQLKEILTAAKKRGEQAGESKKSVRHEMRKAMLNLSPEDPEYMPKVEAQADKMASHIKVRMVAFAKVRQEVYTILTDEQKQEMKEMKEKRMKKMEKGGRKNNCEDE